MLVVQCVRHIDQPAPGPANIHLRISVTGRKVTRMKPLADTHAMLAVEYVRRFGVVHGIDVMRRMNSNRQDVRLNVPGYRHPIALRPKTSDIPAFTQIFVKGDYEFEYPVSDPRFIVDAGANVGYGTIYFANRFPGAHIISIEPEQSNYQQLTFNSSLYENVERFHNALWNEPARMRIQNPNDPKWMARVERISGSDEVNHDIETITVDEILSTTHRNIDIFKIDIEGAEKEVFSSNVEWIDRARMFVIELHDWIKPGCACSFYKALGDRPYRQWFHGEAAFVQML